MISVELAVPSPGRASTELGVSLRSGSAAYGEAKLRLRRPGFEMLAGARRWEEPQRLRVALAFRTPLSGRFVVGHQRGIRIRPRRTGSLVGARSSPRPSPSLARAERGVSWFGVFRETKVTIAADRRAGGPAAHVLRLARGRASATVQQEDGRFSARAFAAIARPGRPGASLEVFARGEGVDLGAGLLDGRGETVLGFVARGVGAPPLRWGASADIRWGEQGRPGGSIEWRFEEATSSEARGVASGAVTWRVERGAWEWRAAARRLASRRSAVSLSALRKFAGGECRIEIFAPVPRAARRARFVARLGGPRLVAMASLETRGIGRRASVRLSRRDRKGNEWRGIARWERGARPELTFEWKVRLPG